MVAQDPRIRQQASHGLTESIETQPRGGVALEVERKRTRAGVPNPVLHDCGGTSRLSDESHEAHDMALSLCESHPAIWPSEIPEGGTPVHISTWPRKNVYVCRV